jgi:COP9 signalosome complex subunit 2
MSGDEMDYGFEYSDDDDEPEEEDVNIENQYYTAKGTRH